jgi:hypothetical protein
MRTVVLSSISSVALLLVSARADAQPSSWNATGEPPQGGPTIVYPRAPQPPASSWDRFGQLGFEIEASGGPMVPDTISPVLAPNLYPTKGASTAGNPNGDIITGREHPYGADVFGLSFSAGYRFLPYLSAGAFFTYANFAAQDGTGAGDYVTPTDSNISQLQRQAWQLGAYVRYYFTMLHPRLQPWVRLGVGYSEDTASYTRGAVQGAHGPLTQDYYLTHQGVVVPLTIGLDWRLAPALSLGPTLGYSRVFGLHGCVDSEFQSDPNNPLPSGITNINTCASPPVQTGDYGVFFGGIFAKLTFGGRTR